MDSKKDNTHNRGKLGVLTPGMGAVATTFYAGVEAVRRGLAKPIGSYTQMGRIARERGGPEVPVQELVPLAHLDDLVFGGWDIFSDNAYESARNAAVIEPGTLEELREYLEGILPMSAVFDRNYIRNIDGPNVKKQNSKRGLAEAVRRDITSFREREGCSRVVMVWCASTEAYNPPAEIHRTIADFEKALDASDPRISPSQIYAYAAMMERVVFINGSPNVTAETSFIQDLAMEKRVPIAGSDFKTGQTLMKTVIAPGLRSRLLGVAGWYSTNILGNRDGQVLEDPESFRSKEKTKSSVLESIFSPQEYPDLYGDLHHSVSINYYPPRGDNKEGWDNIDLFGWLGYPMQIKVNFLCRDSILAAPLVLDLALLGDLAQRKQARGVQEWLSFYFKAPVHEPGTRPLHDLRVQLELLEEALRKMA